MTDEPTKADLQEELRRRDLPVSGTKAELQQRLSDADEDQEKQGQQKETSRDQEESGSEAAPVAGTADGDAGRGGSRPPRANEIARLAVRQLGSLTRHSIEGISGLAREGDEWRVDVEVLEVSRVPPSTDVLATYAVWVDADGELVSYERVERFVRGQAGGGEG